MNLRDRGVVLYYQCPVPDVFIRLFLLALIAFCVCVGERRGLFWERRGLCLREEGFVFEREGVCVWERRGLCLREKGFVFEREGVCVWERRGLKFCEASAASLSLDQYCAKKLRKDKQKPLYLFRCFPPNIVLQPKISPVQSVFVLPRIYNFLSNFDVR